MTFSMDDLIKENRINYEFSAMDINTFTISKEFASAVVEQFGPTLSLQQIKYDSEALSILKKSVPKKENIRHYLNALEFLSLTTYTDYMDWNNRVAVGPIENGTMRDRLPNATMPTIDLTGDRDLVSVKQILTAGMGTVFENKILLCKPVIESVRYGAVCTTVRDLDGDQIPLSLVNLSFNDETPAYGYCPELVPTDVLLLIMHPWYKRADTYASGLIRVDNPAHVRFCLPDDPILACLSRLDEIKKLFKPIDVADLIRSGDRCTAIKLHWNAIWWYSHGLERKPQEMLYERRAGAYLEVKKPLLALKDAELGLSTNPRNLLLIKYKILSLAMLNRCNEALELLRKTERLRRKNAEDSKSLRKRVFQIQDDLRGKFDVVEMLTKTNLGICLEDHVDYISPCIELQKLSDGSYVYVATEGIRVGTLLMACNAVMFMQPTTDDDEAISIAKDGNRQLCQLVMRYPELRDKLYSLYKDTTGVRLKEINDRNPVDIGRLAQLMITHLFDTAGVRFVRHGRGVWLDPSFMQQSCLNGNCIKLCIERIQLVRSCRPIKRGERLSTNFSDTFYCPEGRVQLMKARTCHCELCKFEKTEDASIPKRLFDVHVRSLLTDYTCYKLDELLKEALALRPKLSLNITANTIMSIMFTHRRGKPRDEKPWHDMLKSVVDFWLSVGEPIQAWAVLHEGFMRKESFTVKLNDYWKKEYKHVCMLMFGKSIAATNAEMSFVRRWASS